jgi:hypothetical protein
VSVAWRQAALRTPSVWSKLSVDPAEESYRRATGTRITCLSLAQTWIERSGITPLHIQLIWPGRSYGRYGRHFSRKDWAALILSAASRLVHLELVGGSGMRINDEEMSTFFLSPMPMRKRYAFSDYRESSESPGAVILRGLTRLRFVDISSSSASFPIPDGSFPLESLSLDMSDFIAAVAAWLPSDINHTLRKLTLKGSFFYVGRLTNTPELIELHCLSELHVLSWGICMRLLETFSTPALQLLHIRGGSNSGKGDVNILLENGKFPLLRDFSLEWVKEVDDQLKTFLQAHPDLQILRLIQVPSAKTMAALVNYPARQAALCPRLRRLEVAGFDSERVTLEDVIQARWTTAVPAEDLTDGTRAFSRLSSLIWNGQESLPPAPPSFGDEAHDSSSRNATSA